MNLDSFSLEMLRLFLVCVICDSKCLHSLLFKLSILIVYTLNMSVELRHFSIRNA